MRNAQLNGNCRINKKDLFLRLFFIVMIAAAPAIVYAQEPTLGAPSVLQQALNRLPAVPIAGKSLKFEMGGETWIAKINGRNFLAGSMITQDTGEGSLITLSQTHVYAAIPGVANVGWIRTPGPQIILEYKMGPPASLKLVSISSGKDDSSSGALVSIINSAVEEAVTSAMLNITLPAGTDTSAGKFKIVNAKDVGLNDSDFLVAVNRYSTITITGYSGKVKDLVIPTTLHGLTVTHIGKYAFANNQLTSVIIPDSVIVIGQGAFGGNWYLKSITISDSVLCIESGAFENNNAEKVILGNNLQVIRQNAFKGNSNLSEIKIPDSVMSIERGVFENCNIQKVSLGNNLQIIGQNAFRGNKNLTEITIPDSVTRIDEGAFSNCGIIKINWGNGLKVISTRAFLNNRLTDIILPEGLTYAGSSSFANNPVAAMTIPSSLSQHGRGSNLSGFNGAFVVVNNQEGNLNTLTRIALPADVHKNNMRQFEQELRTFYDAMNKSAGTYVRNAPLPGSNRPYWTRE